MSKYDDADYQLEREESIEYEESINKISERFNNGTETIEDIINYCRNYEIQFENRLTLRVVEKRYFDKLVERIKELEQENKSKQKAYDDCYCEYKNYKQFDSIPKQKVKELIKNETINISGFECIAVEDLEKLF